MHDEIEYSKNLPMIFLPPDSPRWDPYNESYDINKASYLDHGGDMMYPAPKHCNMLEEADTVKIKCNQSSSPTTVLEFKEESKQVDAVIASLIVALDSGESDPNKI